MDQKEIDEYKAEIKEHGDLCVRAKWTMDDCPTLRAAAAALRKKAEWLDELADAGFELLTPVQDDYALIGHPDVVSDDPDEDEDLPERLN